MIKLIALDMDGTTLNDDHIVSERNIAAIKAAQHKGIEVVLLTGRSYADARYLMKNTNLDVAYLCSNGADMRNTNGDIISSTGMPKDDVLEIVTLLQQENVFFDVYVNDYIYTDSFQKQMDTILKIAKVNEHLDKDAIIASLKERNDIGFIKETNSFTEIIQPDGNKVYKIFIMSDDLSKIAELNEWLSKFQQLAISSSGEGNIEITDVRAQKGIALEQYAALKGITLKETMVIGDSYNDLSMMKVAGLAVAMGNAPEDIKKHCHEVTTTNAEDGVALAIEKVVDQ